MTKQAEALMREEIAELKARLKESREEVRLGLAKGGGMSLYGLQRFPVTLGKEQWRIVLEMHDEIRDFLDQNDDVLLNKAEMIARRNELKAAEEAAKAAAAKAA